MNLIKKAVYCYEYLFYKEYICFFCGLEFRMKKEEKDDCIYFMPVCSNSCMFNVISTEINELTNDYIGKYGNEWKKEYIKYLLNPINHHSNHDKKMEMIKNGKINKYGDLLDVQID